MRPLSPPWKDPLDVNAPGQVANVGPLRVRVVGTDGPELIFLHGLGASLRYWGRAYDDLATHRRLIFIDLLGFGGSSKPPGSYDAAMHVEAISTTLATLAVRRAYVVAHSAGGVIGLALARSNPIQFRGFIGFGVPLFESPAAARKHLRALGPLARLMADESPRAHQLCQWMCSHRELARRLAPFLAPRLPGPVAGDGVDHIWDSYNGTFGLLLAGLPPTVAPSPVAERFFYGAGDKTCPPQRMSKALTAGRTELAPGEDHHLPLRQPKWCVARISKLLENMAGQRLGDGRSSSHGAS